MMWRWSCIFLKQSLSSTSVVGGWVHTEGEGGVRAEGGDRSLTSIPQLDLSKFSHCTVHSINFLVISARFRVQWTCKVAGDKKGGNSENCGGRETADAMTREVKKNELILRSSSIVNVDELNSFASVFSKRGEK
ncbi:putative protein phosphatase 2C 73 [Camellia lanceoleosa]|uniref:Uncharacterized protein n=1 Tax=Camellia lanceoleosa TaxID=1840588 RepID=A0ACC0GZH8_9ERIC|nr:putative protein phosphatase 2C 73 [Camellia lanceoleosa]